MFDNKKATNFTQSL